MIIESSLTMLPIKSMSKQQSLIISIMGMTHKIIGFGYTGNKTKNYCVSFLCEGCGGKMWRSMSVLIRCKSLMCRPCYMSIIRSGVALECANEHKKTQTIHKENSLVYLSVNKAFFDMFGVRIDDCVTMINNAKRQVLLECPVCKSKFYKNIYYMTSIKSHGGVRDYCCSKKCCGSVQSGETKTNKRPIFA